MYVGATLEARDRAVALVSDLREVTTTRKGAEKRITKLERRGNTARNQLERDVRKARTRLERQLRGRRRDAERLVRRNRARAEREVSSIERDAEGRRNVVAGRSRASRRSCRPASPPASGSPGPPGSAWPRSRSTRDLPRPADGERRARARFAGLISRRRMQYLSSLNRRRAFGHGGGA